MSKKQTFFATAKAKNIIANIKLVMFSLVFVAGIIYMYVLSDYELVVLLSLGGTFALFLAFAITMSVLSHRTIKKNSRKKGSSNELASDLDTTYLRPLDKAVASTEESILDWYGPMSRNDWGGLGGSILTKEKVSGENTIAVTDKQIICLMIGPADVEAIHSTMGDLVQALPQGDGVSTRKEQFQVAYFKHWDTIMQGVSDRPLAEILATHHNYAIPYDRIQKVSFKKRFINPGLTIELTDGRKLAYAGFNKHRLDTLEQHILARVATA